MATGGGAASATGTSVDSLPARSAAQEVHNVDGGEWLRWARELQAIAQSGLYYARDPDAAGDAFDEERYRDVGRIAAEMMAVTTAAELDDVVAVFAAQTGHATPKVGVRGVVFDAYDRVLLVRERLDDDRWTLPGGWVDVNEPPSTAVCREVQEETGFEVRAHRLLAVWDGDRHGGTPTPFHTWTLFVACEIVGGAATSTHETSEPRFWPVDDPPPLSLTRVTPSQLTRLLELRHDPRERTAFD